MPPLGCDCYGGCWGDHSKDWPSIAIPVPLIELAALSNAYYPTHVAAMRLVNEAGIPYGSYVISKDRLRVETEEQYDLVKFFADFAKL